ncbi:MAG: peptidoglycan binding domain-containing protein [Chloroflexi bacterium]|nr:peptidoglycan binding domain-containing protein [Chloroflexota bacterium]
MESDPHSPSRPVIQMAVEQQAQGRQQVKTPARVPARPRKKDRFSTSEVIIAVAVGGVALIILAGVAFFMLFVLFSMSDRILPGVRVGDTNIGGLPRDEASQLLWNEWNENRQLLISDGKQGWLDSPAGFGLYLDSEATVNKAYELGRASDGLKQFVGLLLMQKEQVLPEVVLNMETARSRFEDYAARLDVPATDAALRYENGEWTAVPGEAGLVIDIAATTAELAAQRALVMSSGYFSLTFAEVQPHFTDVSAALEQLQPVLNRPMRFSAYDPINDETVNWKVEPATFSPWLLIENLQGEPNLTIQNDKLAAYLQEWQTGLGDGRILQEGYSIDDLVEAWKNDTRYSFIIWHQAKTYTVQSGDMLTDIAYHARMPYWKLIEANPDIDPENLLVGDELIIPSKNEMLPLPVVKEKRIVISISEQRMWTYKNGELLNEYVISTGIDDSPTLPGVFQVQTHELKAYASVWDLYMPHFLGIYQGWPGFWNGIHGLPTLSSGVQLWASVLGSKASYGCIIMDLDSAETVYNWAEDGVVVEILP